MWLVWCLCKAVVLEERCFLNVIDTMVVIVERDVVTNGGSPGCMNVFKHCI